LIWPLQLSSAAVLHVSFTGVTWPEHGPYAVPSALHVFEPALHAPTFSVPAGPL
jgi:hypothetical protein